MKTLFTQGLVVLFDQAPDIDAVAQFVPAARSRPATGEHPWIGAAGLTLSREGRVGELHLDVIAEPWPDGMGGQDDDLDLLAAWSMGGMGPYTYPGALQRAVQQERVLSGAARLVERHRGFVLLRTTASAPGASMQLLAGAPRHGPLAELEWMSSVWRSVLELDGAQCAFVPGGERLLDRDGYDWVTRRSTEAGHSPLDLWIGVQMWRVDEDWLVMSTIGLEQLDEIDHEMWVPDAEVDPNDIAQLLRNLALHVVEEHAVFADGDTLDGPGGRWSCRHFDSPVTGRPRPTVRWVPPGRRPPEPLGVASAPDVRRGWRLRRRARE